MFAGSTTPADEEEDYQSHLTRRIEEDIDRFSKDQTGDPDRLVIYLFKRTGKRELWAVQSAISNRDIEYSTPGPAIQPGRESGLERQGIVLYATHEPLEDGPAFARSFETKPM